MISENISSEQNRDVEKSRELNVNRMLQTDYLRKLYTLMIVI